MKILSRRHFVLLAAAWMLPACLAAAPRYDLLIQGALDWELQPLLKALEGKKEVRLRAWTFWTGRIGKQSVVISRTEMGTVNAVASTVLALEHFHPAAIINQGTAGGTRPDLNVFDIVIGEKTTDYGAFQTAHGDAGTGSDFSRWKPMPHQFRLDNKDLTKFFSFDGDKRLLEAALRVPYAKGKLHRGNVGSAFEFNRELDRLTAMRKLFGIDTEDMESAYVAGTAAAYKVPFLAIRILSDNEFHHPELQKVSGEYCAQFVADLVHSLPASRKVKE